jgi:hypothetical protein
MYLAEAAGVVAVKPNFRESKTKEKWKCFLSTLKYSFVAAVAWMALHWYCWYHLRQLVNEKRLICWFFTTTQRYCVFAFDRATGWVREKFPYNFKMLSLGNFLSFWRRENNSSLSEEQLWIRSGIDHIYNVKLL